MYKILLVDDEIETLKDRSQIIINMGYKCSIAENGEEAIDLVNREHPDVVLTDVRMPEKDGFDVLKWTREADPDIPVILFTGFGTIESAVEAMKLGAYNYIQKPISPEIMEVVINQAIEFRNLKKENILLKTQIQASYQMENIVGKSNAIIDVIKRVLKVAKSDANVLIYGESGTGKELIARGIHLNSERSKKPFIPLDCVALPPTLLESEIFGYEQGAFTGAMKSKPGILELADRGTLFLDEIAELELNLQAKLLRVLQERQFRRIGGRKLIDIDVRIISATSWNPENAVKKNKLRQALYYRLNVVPINMPPLRERKEDIPLLVNHFIEKFNPYCQLEVKGISKEAMTQLKSYDWPGNIRELQNVIENTMSLIDRTIIEEQDLPECIKEQMMTFPEQCFQEVNFKEAKKKYLDFFSKHYLDHLLDQHDGNMSKVARIAGISRRTLYRIIKKN